MIIHITLVRIALFKQYRKQFNKIC